MGVIRRRVPTLIHDGKAYVEAIHYDQAVEENVKLRDLCERAVDALRYEANPVCDEWDDWPTTHPRH